MSSSHRRRRRRGSVRGRRLGRGGGGGEVVESETESLSGLSGQPPGAVERAAACLVGDEVGQEAA